MNNYWPPCRRTYLLDTEEYVEDLFIYMLDGETGTWQPIQLVQLKKQLQQQVHQDDVKLYKLRNIFYLDW